MTLEERHNEVHINSNFQKLKDDNKKGRPKKSSSLKEDKEKKKNTLKKSMIKKKALDTVYLIKNISQSETEIPTYIINIIEKGEFDLDNLNEIDQKDCYEYFSKKNKIEIVIEIFLKAKNFNEIENIKNKIFKKSFFNNLFLNIKVNN